jgi:hypothetical protein
MMTNLILGLIILICLIAKEEIAINEELVISISFIITIAIIKTMVKDSANEAFNARAEEQENEIITQGKKIIHVYQQIITYAYGFLESNTVGNTMAFTETLKVSNELVNNETLSNKTEQFIDQKLNAYSTLIIEDIMKVSVPAVNKESLKVIAEKKIDSKFSSIC